MNETPDVVLPAETGGETHVTPSEPAAQVNERSAPAPVTWEGDQRYFQTGKKAGKLKPVSSPKPSGLDFESLKVTGAQATPGAPAQPSPLPSDPAVEAGEKKRADARVAAKLVMRSLDMIIGFVSAGQYGRDFTPAQIKDRNAYRDELDKSWAEYLATLDVAMHPAIVAIAGSIIYVAPAFETPRGQERVNSLSEKLFGKIGAAMFRRRK